MRKYYYIFCLTIIVVFLQLVVFVSNINPMTDPTPDKEILNLISETFNIPWYKGDLKYGFFYGLGTSKTQIKLLWMDFVDIVLLYIYIDYFSYCIYQDSDNLGSTKDKFNKINYYKLRSNKKFYNCIKDMKDEKLKEYNECMEYNLGIKINDIKYKLGLSLTPIKDESKKELVLVSTNKITEDQNESNKQNIILDVKESNKSTTPNIIIENNKENDNNEEEQEEEEKKLDKSEKEKIKIRWKNFFANFYQLFYLSLHNIILIIIIITSMMVPGLLSLFYIIFSLYFLITSDKMYLGKKYFYFKAVKKILRVVIIIDIGAQILYQIPVFYRDPEEKTTFDKILDIIGFNRIIDYGKGNDISYDDGKDDIEIDTEQMVLVFCKAITYFFMGIQILIYSSQNFQEYYLVYLITRKLDLKRKSLMNAFRFNNKRIKTIEESIKLRENMSLDMKNLIEKLDDWHSKLSKLDAAELQANLITRKSSVIKDSNLRGRQREDKIYEEKIVKNYIRKLILNKFLIRLEKWFYQFAVDYSKINPDEKDLYERDVIQGRTDAKSFIEKMVDVYLDNLKLDSFTEKEMIELKKFFVETKEQMKKYNEQKEKRKNKQMEKFDTNSIPGIKKKQHISLKNLLIKEIEEKQTVDLIQPKFQEIEILLKSDLFEKYLKTSYLIKSLLIDLLTYCSKKFQFVVYFMMILNHIQNASLISMVYPLSIFCYAIFEYPRPSKGYWKLCLLYSIIILALKYILQLKLFVEIFGYDPPTEGNDEISSKYETIITNLEYYKIGFKYLKTTYGAEFFNYIVFDALIIIFLLLNNLLLIINGLWNKREQEIENIYVGMERVTKTRDLLPKEIDNLKEFNDYFLVNDRKDYDSLFPRIRNEKPGNDFYLQYTSGMILVIIFIIIFYTSMVKDVNYGALNKETNQFSGSMILYLLLHIFFLCYDRVIYINQNRNNLKYEYIIYTKAHMKQINEYKFISIKSEISEKYDYNPKKDNFIIPADYAKNLKKEFSIIYIQLEDFNKPLFNKYILHLFIVLAGHAFIFFYAPFYGNYTVYKTFFCDKTDEEYKDNCNDFNNNSYLILFYIIYMIYFIFSGMQIKFGYYDMKKKSILKKNYNTMNKLFNTIFKSIPFLREIKLSVDWAFTATSLDIFQWYKYENVYDTVYTTYCNMKVKNISKVGQLVGKISKASMGGILSFGLILLLVFPILLFSSLNPTNQSSNLNGAILKIDLSFKDSSGLIKNYTLFEKTKPEAILDFEKNEEIFNKELEEYGYSESVEVKNFPHDQMQKLNFSDTSERNWGMTKPHINKLIELLTFNETNDKENEIVEVQLIIDYEFQRYLPVEARTPGDRHGIIIYDKTNKTLNSTLEIKKIRDAIENCVDAEATFKNFYSAPIRLTANIDSREIKDEDAFDDLDIYLGFEGCKKEYVDNEDLNFNDYYKEKNYNKSYLNAYFTCGTLGKKGKEGIFFYILSDKVSSTTSGYSVITFYVTFVLLAGNYVRNFFAGEQSKIVLTEMPDCIEIIKLCEGIKIARNSFDFDQEEYLYYILIELMRSPDYLKYLTKSSVDQYNNRKKLTDKMNNPDCFRDEELADD